MLIETLTALTDAALAAPTDPPSTPPTGGTSNIIDTSGIVTWFATIIAPILIGGLGIVILARARQGQVSASLTSSGVAILGIVMIVGGGALMAFGDDIVNLILQ